MGHYSTVVYWHVNTGRNCSETTLSSKHEGKTPPVLPPRKSYHFKGPLPLQHLRCGKPSGVNYSHSQRCLWKTPPEYCSLLLASLRSGHLARVGGEGHLSRAEKSIASIGFYTTNHLNHSYFIATFRVAGIPHVTLGKSRQRFKSSPISSSPDVK